MKSGIFPRIPVAFGLTLIAGMAAWTAVTRAPLLGHLVSTGTTGCTGTLPPGTYGDVVVPVGAACTINSSVTITGGAQVDASATLHDTGASIGGSLSATASSNVFVSGSGGGYSSTAASIGGSFDVTGAQTVSVINANIGCSMSVQNTTVLGSVSITNNNVGTNLGVTNNAGLTTVIGNKIGTNAQCSGNLVFVGSGNTTGGSIDSCNALL